jgi:hypothetical protein
MITDESLTVSEAVQWCAGAISHREAARLRQLTAQVHNKPEDDDGLPHAATRPIDVVSMYANVLGSCLDKVSTRDNADWRQRANWRV